MNKILILFVSLLIFTGCSSLKVTNDYDPDVSLVGLKSYTVLPLKNDAPNTLVNERIIEAITNNLNAKRYTLSDKASADFHVQFQIKVKHDVPSNTSFGVGIGTFSGNTGGSLSSSRRQIYDEGTLIIDMLDPSDGKVLWRSTATDALKQFDSPEERRVYTDKVINAMLASFPQRTAP